MKANEIITLLKNATPDSVFEVREKIENNEVLVIFNLESSKFFVTVDFRNRIDLFLLTNRISKQDFADAIGCPRTSFYDYLKHNRDLPYKYLERAIGIIEASNKQ